jgi:ring-1,2-phenylacetyl-CoA epoxidase subunit PaaE
VSNYIIDKLNVGDLVEVMEPMGDFTLSNDYVMPETHVFLWGAGSGITPLMSIAKYALYNKLAHHVTLVYGNRTSESVIFYDKIKSLKGHYKDTFTALHFHTLPAISADNPDVIQGRIDPDKVLSALKLEDDLNSSVHYVCGPVGLKESVKGALLKLGINRQRIFCEDFEIERDPKEFENIVTRSVSINKNGHKTAVEVIKGKSILEAGLDSLLELSYSCQTGNCTVCKATLIKGEIKMIGAQKIDNLKTGECLLCCSFPVDDNVEVGVE